MHKKALTVAIAGALAAPMAAQAVDVTLSGHVNRALFITDSDSSTKTSVMDNGSSGTRIRVKGTGEMMDGGSAGVLLEYSAGGSLGLRYADVWFSGGYGKVSIGQGDQGGEGSVYKGAAAVLGTGHGQATNGVASNYYTSLDGGQSRNERLRYDSPAVGPVSASVSVGNGDQVSAGISLSQDFGGTSFRCRHRRRAECQQRDQDPHSAGYNQRFGRRHPRLRHLHLRCLGRRQEPCRCSGGCCDSRSLPVRGHQLDGDVGLGRRRGRSGG